MKPKIIENPHLGWCAVCQDSWRPDMIAVRFPGMTVCGDCVLKAAALVTTEQQRRADDERPGGAA